MSATSAAEARPQSAVERSREHLTCTMSQLDRLCGQLSMRLKRASVLYVGPSPEKPGAPEPADPPVSDMSITQLEAKIAAYCEQANQLSDRFSEYLP